MIHFVKYILGCKPPDKKMDIAHIYGIVFGVLVVTPGAFLALVLFHHGGTNDQEDKHLKWC